jgi:DNA-binding transcriptional MerR regulator
MKTSKLKALREMELSLEPAQELLHIRTPNHLGEVVTATYLLKEPSESASCKWRDALVKATKLDNQGKPIGMGDISDSDALLLSLCLFKRENGDDIPVDKKLILGWPARVVRPLVEACKEMGGMDDEEETLEQLEERKQEIEEKIASLRAQDNGQPQEGAVKN